MMLFAVAGTALIAVLFAGEAGLAAVFLGSLSFLGAQLAGRAGMLVAYAQTDPRNKALCAIAVVTLRFLVWIALFATLLAAHRAMHETGAQWMIAGLVASMLAQTIRDYRSNSKADPALAAQRHVAQNENGV